MNGRWQIVQPWMVYLQLAISDLPFTFPTDHVDHAESWDDISQHIVFDHFVKGRHGDETGRAHSYSVRSPSPVTPDIKA